MANVYIRLSSETQGCCKSYWVCSGLQHVTCGLAMSEVTISQSCGACCPFCCVMTCSVTCKIRMAFVTGCAPIDELPLVAFAAAIREPIRDQDKSLPVLGPCSDLSFAAQSFAHCDSNDCRRLHGLATIACCLTNPSTFGGTQGDQQHVAETVTMPPDELKPLYW